MKMVQHSRGVPSAAPPAPQHHSAAAAAAPGRFAGTLCPSHLTAVSPCLGRDSLQGTWGVWAIIVMARGVAQGARKHVVDPLIHVMTPEWSAETPRWAGSRDDGAVGTPNVTLEEEREGGRVWNGRGHVQIPMRKALFSSPRVGQ